MHRRRGNAWRQDVDVLLTRFLTYDRSFSQTAKAATRARLERLKSSADSLTDQVIMVQLARAIALSGNAHTRLYLTRSRTEVRRWPIRVWWFRNELRVVRAGPEFRDALGCRVTGIGRSTVEQAFSAISDITAGNASWQRYMSAYFLTSPDILFGARVISNPERTEVTLLCGTASRTVSLTPLPLVRSRSSVEAWLELVPGHPNHDSTSSCVPLAAVPRYVRRPWENYWFDRLGDGSVLYVQYNRSQPMPDRPMDEFVGSVLASIASQRPKALIVDVRFNTGGDFGTGTPLVDSLMPRLRGIPVMC
jgi:hypothetical protein